jgi:hypothetical protein
LPARKKKEKRKKEKEKEKEETEGAENSPCNRERSIYPS